MLIACFWFLHVCILLICVALSVELTIPRNSGFDCGSVSFLFIPQNIFGVYQGYCTSGLETTQISSFKWLIVYPRQDHDPNIFGYSSRRSCLLKDCPNSVWKISLLNGMHRFGETGVAQPRKKETFPTRQIYQSILATDCQINRCHRQLVLDFT